MRYVAGRKRITVCGSDNTILPSTSQKARFMGPTWAPPGSCRPQVGPMLAPWTLLSGLVLRSRWVAPSSCSYSQNNRNKSATSRDTKRHTSTWGLRSWQRGEWYHTSFANYKLNSLITTIFPLEMKPLNSGGIRVAGRMCVSVRVIKWVFKWVRLSLRVWWQHAYSSIALLLTW